MTIVAEPKQSWCCTFLGTVELKEGRLVDLYQLRDTPDGSGDVQIALPHGRMSSSEANNIYRLLVVADLLRMFPPGSSRLESIGCGLALLRDPAINN